jgi:CheY-like chemotaxis protein
VRPDLSYATVLVVDDYATNLDVAKWMLEKYKMTVDCVMGGQDAVDMIEQESKRYDAIFMDHMMPGIDGIEAARLIRRLGTGYAKNIPIIALTANAVAGNEQLFLDNGFQAFLTKPINLLKLDSVIRKWIMKETQDPAAPTYEAAEQTVAETEPKEPNYAKINIPGINAKLGLSIYENDLEIYIDILYAFADSIPAELAKLQNPNEQTLKDYAINVHTIKGSAASIGAKHISETAAELERAAKSGDLDTILTQNDNLIKNTHSLLENIRTWLCQD